MASSFLKSINDSGKKPEWTSEEFPIACNLSAGSLKQQAEATNITNVHLGKTGLFYALTAQARAMIR